MNVCEFKACLVYIVSSRTARTTKRDVVKGNGGGGGGEEEKECMFFWGTLAWFPAPKWVVPSPKTLVPGFPTLPFDLWVPGLHAVHINIHRQNTPLKINKIKRHLKCPYKPGVEH